MSLERTIARLALKMPAPMLVKLAGGSPVVVGGRTLDAQTQFLAHAASKQPPPDPMTVDAVRAGERLMTEMFGGMREPGVAVSEITIPAQDRELGARVYRPDGQDPKAAPLVFFHFGGGVIGTLDTCDAFCSILAATIKAPVVSVDYRLAPEHPWPANRADALDSFIWVRDHADQFGAPVGRAAVGGDSMGGHMSAVLCQDLKAAGEAQPLLQLLIYPATDLTAADGSMETYAQSWPLTADVMAWFMVHYLPDGVDPEDPALSPIKASDLSDLAPAIVVTAGHDPLEDQGAGYAAQLEAAGVNTLFRRYDTLAHGFTAMTGAVTAADNACREIAKDVARAYRAMGS